LSEGFGSDLLAVRCSKKGFLPLAIGGFWKESVSFAEPPPIGDSSSYDLTINTAELTVEAATEVIVATVQRKRRSKERARSSSTTVGLSTRRLGRAPEPRQG
jgi:hypothetical protein